MSNALPIARPTRLFIPSVRRQEFETPFGRLYNPDVSMLGDAEFAAFQTMDRAFLLQRIHALHDGTRAPNTYPHWLRKLCANLYAQTIEPETVTAARVAVQFGYVSVEDVIGHYLRDAAKQKLGFSEGLPTTALITGYEPSTKQADPTVAFTLCDGSIVSYRLYEVLLEVFDTPAALYAQKTAVAQEALDIAIRIAVTERDALIPSDMSQASPFQLYRALVGILRCRAVLQRVMSDYITLHQTKP